MAELPKRMNGLKDADWVYNAFMVKKDDLPDMVREYTTFSSVSISAMDTSLGGHPTMNPPPSFTPTADLRSGILLANDRERTALKQPTWGLNVFHSQVYGKISTGGAGRYYHEAINETMQTVSIQFGRPRFLGFFNFFFRFYNSDAAQTARDGRGPSFFFRIGQTAGNIVRVAATLTLATSAFVYIPFSVALPFTALMMFTLARPASGFYSLDSTMGAYWSRVTTIVNAMAANRKLIGRPTLNEGPAADMDDNRDPATPEYLKAAHKVFPDLFRENGNIDIYQVARRYGMYMHARREYIRSQLESFKLEKDENLSVGINKLREIVFNKVALIQKTESIETYLDRYFQSTWGSAEFREADSFGDSLNANLSALATDPNATPPPENGNTTDTSLAQDSNQTAGDIPPSSNTRRVWIKNPKFGQTPEEPEMTFIESIANGVKKILSWRDFDLDLQQASQWIAFYVQNSGSVNESFSNRYSEAEIASTLNGTASSARSARFNFMNGKTGIGLVDETISAVLDTVKGAISGVGLGGLFGIAGGSFVHIPKQFNDSSCNFPTTRFTLALRSPYGDQLSQFLNLDIPVAMWLAAALPISTGNQSYSDPFYCTVYSEGKCLGRMMGIDSLDITRGVGNLGWNKDHRALGIDIQIGFVDMNNIMHAPLSQNFNPLKPWGLLFDDDSAFKDYLGAMTSMSLADLTLTSRKMSINMATQLANIDSYFSWSHISSAVSDTTLVKTVGKLVSWKYGSDSFSLQ